MSVADGASKITEEMKSSLQLLSKIQHQPSEEGKEGESTAAALKLWKDAAAADADGVAQEGAGLLVAALQGAEGLDTQANILEVMADLCKSEAARVTLGNADILPKIVDVLRAAAEKHHTRARIQCFRALGNLCYDNDDNRKRVLEAKGVQALIAAMQSASVGAPAAADGAGAGAAGSGGHGEEHELANRVGAGAVLNAATDNDEVQKELVQCGAISNLMWLFQQAGSAAEREAAFNALHRFQNNAAALQGIAGAGGVRALVTRLMTEDDENTVNTGALLRALSESEAVLPEFAKDNVPQDILTLAQKKAERPRSAGLASVLLSIILADPTCRSTLLDNKASSEQLLPLIVRWVEGGDDMAVPGALAIGNLVHDEPSALKLGSTPGLLPALVTMLSHDVSDTQHASLGCLKNLSNALANKAAILSLNPAPHLLQAMNTCHLPIQYMAASISRNLCIGQPAAAVAAFGLHPGFVQRLAKLGRSEEQRIQAEASRALVNFVRFGKDAALSTSILDEDGIANFVGLLRLQFPLLHSEGLVALVLLTATLPASRDKIRASDVAAELAKLLESPAEPMDVKCNALSLTAALLTGATNLSEHEQALIQAVRVLDASSTIPQIKQQTAMVLSHAK